MVNNVSNFKDMVREAIDDELQAVAQYATMARMVESEVLRAILLSIANDEAAHARTFMVILELDP
ncbi:MAG: ferritin family protein [Clostridia bacterium]|nr:ferritin family protein [Clostridia bacterium]